MNTGTLGPLEWSVSERPATGEVTSGDAYAIEASGDEMTLITVVDGLGHGPPAASASARVLEVVHEERNQELPRIFERCDAALHGDRGAVMTMALVTHPRGAPATFTWLGVGNVQGVVVRAAGSAPQAREWLLLRAGLIGGRLPALRTKTLPLALGDVIVLATDGIQLAFGASIRPSDTVPTIGATVLSTHGRFDDDALVLVARYRGWPA
jgi:phosphoserine phosphatase RsbX